MSDEKKVKDSLYQRDLKQESSSLCYYITRMVYGPAPKKKVANTTFFDNLELAYLIGICNTMVSSVEFIKNSHQDGWTTEEILGAFQLDLKTSWDCLAKHKIGLQSFRKISLDDIIEAESPRDFLCKQMVPVKR